MISAQARKGEVFEYTRLESVRKSIPLSSSLLLGIFILLLMFALGLARTILIPVALAFTVYMVLRPVTRIWERIHVPRMLGAALTLIMLVGMIAFASIQLIGPAQEWISDAPQRLGKIETKVRDLLKPIDKVRQSADQIGRIATGEGQKSNEVNIRDQSFFNQLFGGTQTMIGNVIVILVLLFFLLSAGDQMWVSLSHLCSPVIGRGTFMQIVYDMEKRLSGYLFVLTIINCCVGLIIGLGMFLIGMPNPVVWGVVAGLVNFVPYVGALTGEIIVTLVALFSFDDIGHALLAPLIYLCVAFIEGNFLTPMILGRQFTLSPVVIIISLLFWGIVWGIIGLFLAVPILMLTKILCENIPSLAPVARVLEK